MKKNIWKNQYAGCLLAIGSFALLACSESEGISSNANLSTDKITFDANIRKEWDASSAIAEQRAISTAISQASQSAPLSVKADFSKLLYLHPVVQEGIHVWNEKNQPVTRGGILLDDVEQERVVASRGSKKSALSDYSSFGVTAIYPSSSSDYTVLLDNQQATTGANSKWFVADNSNAKWPMNNELVSFHAYAPHSTKSYSMLSSTADNTNVLTTIHYDASKTDITNQPDLIVATQTGSRSNASANKDVALQFTHALTAVTFAMSSDLADVIGTGANLEKVRLVGIPNQGDCQLMAKDGKHTAASQSWTNINGSETFEFDLSKQNVTAGKDLALTSGNQTLMMIPQTLPSGAKAEFIFKINGYSQTLSVDLANTKWVAGSSVIYKLSAKAINTLSSTQITYPNTWADYSYPKTAFDVNEAIGLYVVDNNNKVVASNVKVTKAANGTWKMSSKVLKLAKYHYFAYYPYSPTAPTVDATASDATAFFADKVSKWRVKADQSASSSADLKAQDLQVAKGVVGSDASTLTFAMSHQMGLAVLNLEAKNIVKTRKFNNNNYTYYYPNLSGRATSISKSDYTDSSDKQNVMASNNFTGSNKPYKTSTANRYIQVVKPGTAYSYSAADQANSPRSAWGSAKLGKACSIKVSSAAGVQPKSITTDADFYYLARVYTYTGRVESFTAPVSGKYKMECWGAQGSNMLDKIGGKGGYCCGTTTLSQTLVYICVGAQRGGFGGGGVSTDSERSHNYGNDGGGATDVRLTYNADYKDFNSLKSRIIVAAGGGGANHRNTVGEVPQYGQGDGGYGGGLTGGDGIREDNTISFSTVPYLLKCYGGTQTAGGKVMQNVKRTDGTFDDSNYKQISALSGVWGYATSATTSQPIQTGGGGGYYGGGSPAHVGGSGGSSFISGYTGCNAIAETSTASNIVHTGNPNHYSGCVFTDATMIAGNASMPSPNGGTETGHSGNGACIISWFLK